MTITTVLAIGIALAFLNAGISFVGLQQKLTREVRLFKLSINIVLVLMYGIFHFWLLMGIFIFQSILDLAALLSIQATPKQPEIDEIPQIFVNEIAPVQSSPLIEAASIPTNTYKCVNNLCTNYNLYIRQDARFCTQCGREMQFVEYTGKTRSL